MSRFTREARRGTLVIVSNIPEGQVISMLEALEDVLGGIPVPNETTVEAI